MKRLFEIVALNYSTRYLIFDTKIRAMFTKRCLKRKFTYSYS